MVSIAGKNMDYIDMGVWMCRTKFISEVKRHGKFVSVKIEGRWRTRNFATREKAELFKHMVENEMYDCKTKSYGTIPKGYADNTGSNVSH
jgi:hypothetical protein